MPRHSAPQQPAWLRPRLVVAFVVATAGLVTAIWLPTRNDSADATERNRSRNNDSRRTSDRSPSLAEFTDEFRGERGSTVDPAKWSLRADDADNGLQFSESTRNARLDGDGNLVIVLREQDRGGFSSARLVTKETLRAQSGHVEARIKTPEGRGLEPAFALLGAGRPSSGALDVLTESLSDDDFHTYAAAWTPGEVVLSVDGEEVDRVKPDGVDTDQPFRLALSLAVGDNREGTDFPARMVVDSVKFSAVDASAEPITQPTTTAPTTAPTTEPPTTAPTTPPARTTPPTTPPTSEPVAKKWAPFTVYVAGQLVKFKGDEYQVQETHTSLPGWEPTALPNLFKTL